MQAERFCTYLADTLEAQHLHHHLRYLVYCQRKHFEKGSVFDTLPQEKDSYDATASRFIVEDRVQGNWIGTARLVPNDCQPLPAQTLGAINRDHARVFARQPA